MKKLDYETIICVDLRPFDPAKEDCGLQSYLEVLGFQPTVIVFLNFFVDFLHEHQAIDDTPINRMTVGQRGLPTDSSWTKLDLEKLVKAMKERGISPVLGILSSTRSDIWQDIDIDWEYSEILQTKRGNATLFGGSINPLKRFRDGSFYEDRFAADLVAVLNDFGFEGYVAGDGMLGLRGPRETLADTDFSEDMVQQFKSFAGLNFNEIADYDERADYIVTHHFAAWVKFYVHRWCQHTAKVSKALRENGKSFMAIDSWSRNPEELITAFGIDYRKLYENGLEAVFVQARETNKWRKHREGEYVREENSVYTFLTHKAYEPRLKYYWAEATINLPEFWNSVLDLPHVLERETYAYLWTTRFHEGRYIPTTDGICVIWGNDLTPAQWEWLVSRWDHAYEQVRTLEKPIGLTLVWNEIGIQEHQAANKRYGEWFAHLLNQGICIQSIMHEEDAALPTGVEQLADRYYLTFDPAFLKRNPAWGDRIFVMNAEFILFAGMRYSYGEGVTLMKEKTGIRTSRGRVFGFENREGNWIMSIENPNNLFYEHVKVEIPMEIGEVEVLPPRQWYSIPHTTERSSTMISVAPDASTQLVIKPANREKQTKL